MLQNHFETEFKAWMGPPLDTISSMDKASLRQPKVDQWSCVQSQPLASGGRGWHLVDEDGPQWEGCNILVGRALFSVKSLYGIACVSQAPVWAALLRVLVSENRF